MFRYGECIVCVNNDGVSKYLTVGKVYIVTIVPGYLDTIGNTVSIIDDIDRGYGYFADRFILLKEYRKQKLKKVCLE